MNAKTETFENVSHSFVANLALLLILSNKVIGEN